MKKKNIVHYKKGKISDKSKTDWKKFDELCNT